MPGTPITYTYAARSTAVTGDDGTRLGLATTSPAAFLDGTVDRGDVFARALLRIGEIAATRFYSFITATDLIEMYDPIITTGDGDARFEALSTCCGVAARLDLLPGSMDVTVERADTTNVDVGPHLRHLLAQVRAREPVQVTVGPHGLGVRTLDGDVFERTVDLPERWVRSLAELQVLASRMAPVLELDQRQARALLTSLPRTTGPRDVFWLQPATDGLRLGVSRRPGSVAVGGPERLRAIEPLLRHATTLRLYAPEQTDGPSATWWELDLPHARFGLALSPYSARGFSGEGALLEGLADDDPQAHLAAQGALGYDLAERRYFSRSLPFGRDVLKTNPRLARARRLVEQERVRRDGDRWLVRGTRSEHVVQLSDDAACDRCTCAWFAEHQGSRGPCAHVLAARIVTGTETERVPQPQDR